MDNTMYSGSTFFYDTTSKTPEDCHSKCLKYEDCKGFGFHKPSSECLLLESIDYLTSNMEDFEGGLKNCDYDSKYFDT